MLLTVASKKLRPMFYENPHGLEKVRVRVQEIEPEEATQVGEEETPTIKGARVTFLPTTGGKRAKPLSVRMERKKLIRLAHAVGKIKTAPGSTADTEDLIGEEVYLFIEIKRRDGSRRIARFTSIDGPFGG